MYFSRRLRSRGPSRSTRGPVLDEQAPVAAEETLRRLTAAIGDRGVPVHTAVHEGEITSEIGRTARELGADLIVLGTHDRSGLARLALGSVTGAYRHYAVTHDYRSQTEANARHG
jgi:nucleotide-binding universal stress UspA family protein